jgi:hypothetical protein
MPDSVQVFRQLPMRLDLEFSRGDTLSVPLSFERNVGTRDDPELEPRDMSGHTFLAQVRRKPNSTAVEATFTVEEVDLSVGKAIIVLAPEQTAVLPKAGVWDIQSTAPDGVVRTWVAGSIKPDPDVSREEPEVVEVLT